MTSPLSLPRSFSLANWCPFFKTQIFIFPRLLTFIKLCVLLIFIYFLVYFYSYLFSVLCSLQVTKSNEHMSVMLILYHQQQLVLLTITFLFPPFPFSNTAFPWISWHNHLLAFYLSFFFFSPSVLLVGSSYQIISKCWNSLRLCPGPFPFSRSALLISKHFHTQGLNYSGS